ncbi:hypothetical protein SDC9_198534 [bioreactor metagenome]|uniref:Uncharacterized protein n=1 Tax=bioreactor metagenome TaxID=1076179 RepID=A0A645IR83_9ZZZZ
MHQIKGVIAADARHIEVFRENQDQQDADRKHHLIARQWIDNRCFWFPLAHSMLRGIPAADLRQHDNGQQRRKNEPGHITFAVRGDNHCRQQRSEGATKITAHLEDGLGKTVASA